MAITVNTTEQTLKKERRVVNFTVTTPPDQDPSLTVVYGEYLINNSGEVIARKDQIAILSVTKQQMIDMLPKKNPYGLPTYTDLYNGLKDLFDNQFISNFSGMLPS